MMKSKYLIGATVLVICISLVGWYALNQKSPPSNITENTNAPDENDSARIVEQSATIPPTVIPTFPPLSESVVKIDDQQITVNGKSGNMIIPKDASKVSMYKRISGAVSPAEFSDVKVGQKVTVLIIVPGKKVDFTIEE